TAPNPYSRQTTTMCLAATSTRASTRSRPSSAHAHATLIQTNEQKWTMSGTAYARHTRCSVIQLLVLSMTAGAPPSCPSRLPSGNKIHTPTPCTGRSTPSASSTILTPLRETVQLPASQMTFTPCFATTIY
ncbi:hypothetical protein IWW49_004923, partial [Coemansia sp. RSA 1797]